jgi:hypothetical protein
MFLATPLVLSGVIASLAILMVLSSADPIISIIVGVLILSSS